MNDLVWPWTKLRTQLHKTCVFFGAHHENLNEDIGPYSSGRNVAHDSSFRQYGLYGYLRGFLGQRCQKTVELSTAAIFSTFAGYIFGSFRDKATPILHSDTQSLVGFQLIENVWPWITLNGYCTLNSVFAPLRIASETAIFENSCVKNNEHRTTLSAARIFSK